jgi:hypothetical protein
VQQNGPVHQRTAPAPMAPLVGPAKADATAAATPASTVRTHAATPASTVRRITRQYYANVCRASGLDIKRTMRFTLYREAEQEQAIRNVMGEYSFLNQSVGVEAAL